MTTPVMKFAVRGEGTDTLEIDIYDEIGASWWGDGVDAKSVRRTLQSAKAVKTIKLRVNSPGGDVFDGWAIYNLLNEHSARVVAHVDALAASMASVVIMAADEIQIAAGGMLMIHNPWMYTAGDANELRTRADMLEKMAGQLAQAYVARTGLELATVLTMMDEETWMTADEAKAFGFVDEVKPMKGAADVKKAYASVDVSAFAAAPQWFQTATAAARAATVDVPGEGGTRPIRLASATPPTPAISLDAEPGVTIPPTNSARPDDGVAQPNAVTRAKGRTPMDMNQLRSEHPDVYDAAVQAGVERERKRVRSHLKMGKAAGAIDIALASIESGVSSTDEEVQADYFAARLTSRDLANAQADADAAAKVLDGATAGTAEDKPKDLVDSAIDAYLGGAATEEEG